MRGYEIVQINEIIVQNYAEVTAAVQQNAKRLLLVSDLALGGTTPSYGTIAEATRYAHDHNVSISILVRPRSGSADYNDAEIKIMDTDLLEIQKLGSDGVVFGVLTQSGNLDEDAMANLVAAAGGMALGFTTGLSRPTAPIEDEAVLWLSDNDFTRYYAPMASERELTTETISSLMNANQKLSERNIQLIPTNFHSKAEMTTLTDKTNISQTAILPSQI